MTTPLAFSPGSVTCFFRPVFDADPSRTYSQGLAINLTHGVTAGLRPASRSTMRLNGRPLEIASVCSVLDAFAPEPVEVDFESPLPLGCGFGVSAACALTATFAIARRFGLTTDRQELGMIAHRAEVSQRTGLGDVCSQLCGGVVHRHCRKSPLDADRMSFAPRLVYYRVFGDLGTAKILTTPETLARIQAEGDVAMNWLHVQTPEVPFETLLERSWEFDQKTGLLTDSAVRQAISDVMDAGGRACMILLGRSVLASAASHPADAWTACGIDQQGTRWL